MLTLAASTLAAVALAAAVAGRSCRAEDDSPEGAVRALIAAAEAGDRQAIHELLGPETRERLAHATRRATELVGGDKRYDELDLIAIGEPGDDWAVVDTNARETNTGTVVDIELVSGAKATLPVVRVEGRWRVELPGYVPGPSEER